MAGKLMLRSVEETGERLADRVYGQLLAFVVEQNLSPGDRLPSEHELARLAAVSRPVVREALMRLQGDGLIEARRGAGSFLKQRPPEHQIHHLLPAQVRARIESFEVRIALEPVAARLAALHGSAEDLIAIKAAASDLFVALGAGAPAGEHDFELHRAIAKASHNLLFELTLKNLDTRLEALIVPSLTLGTKEAHERAQLLRFEHAAIVEAIVRGEAEVAEAAMRLHLMRARSRATAMRW